MKSNKINSMHAPAFMRRLLQRLRKYQAEEGTIVTFSLLILLAFYFLYVLFFGERLWLGEGIAWDAEIYAAIARQDTSTLFSGNHGPYYLQRILPSVLVHYLAVILNAPITEAKQLIFTWYCYHLIILTVAFFYYWRIASHFKWHLPIRIVAFSALFLNFPVLKHASYIVPMTDLTAMVLGLILFYYFLKRRTAGVLLATILGAFTYPSFAYIGIFLLMFQAGETDKPHVKKVGFSIEGAIAMTLFAGLLIFAINTDFHLGESTSINQLDSVTSIFLISFTCVSLYVYMAVKPLVDWKILVTKKTEILWLNILMGLVVFVALKWCIVTVGGHAIEHSNGPSAIRVLKMIAIDSVVNPFGFIVSHAAYYGPAVILILLLWKEIGRQIHNYGYGLILFTGFMLLFSVDSQSRLLINMWPAVAILMSEALSKNYRIDLRFAYVFVAVSLVTSKCWYPINVGDMSGSFLEFPMQRYFMNFGPWKSDGVYLVESAILLMIMPLFYALLAGIKKNESKVFA